MTFFIYGCHAEPVEAWWAGLLRAILRRAQDDRPSKARARAIPSLRKGRKGFQRWLNPSLPLRAIHRTHPVGRELKNNSTVVARLQPSDHHYPASGREHDKRRRLLIRGVLLFIDQHLHHFSQTILPGFFLFGGEYP